MNPPSTSTAGISPVALFDQHSRLDDVSFKAIAESMPHMIWTAKADGTSEYFNRLGCEFIGTTIDEGTTVSGWLELIHPDDIERAGAEWVAAMNSCGDFDTIWRVLRADGEYRRLRVTGRPIINGSDQIARWVGTCEDVEEQEQVKEDLYAAERSARQSLSLLQTFQATAPIGIGFVDCDLRLQQANEVLAAMGGDTVEKLTGQALEDFILPPIWERLKHFYFDVLEHWEPLVNQEFSIDRPVTGGALTFLLSLAPVEIDDERVGIGIVAVDITERQQDLALRNIVMDTMAEGLYAIDRAGNLTFMNAAAEKMLGWSEDELRGKNVHEIVHFQHSDGTHHPAHECPLDGIHDHGHQVRATDDVFTRKDGTMVPVAYSGSPLKSGECVDGVVVVFRDMTDEKAESARVQQELNALSWVGRIRDAIDEDRLVLYAQPILPMIDGEQSQELLLRMVGREGEIIAPGAFLPVAEKYGLITEIDRWVVARGIRMAADGRRVEINLSAESLAAVDMLPLIERELRESGADPAHVVFEITETALMREMEHGEAFAHGVAALGCGVALDDFGTGFGSFTYLKRLPIKYLKIDIDFVRDLPDNPANQHLVKATVNLAQGFGQQTIAEGVEDEATLQLLQEYGVDFVQGFHLGRPAPIVDDPNDRAK